MRRADLCAKEGRSPSLRPRPPTHQDSFQRSAKPTPSQARAPSTFIAVISARKGSRAVRGGKGSEKRGYTEAVQPVPPNERAEAGIDLSMENSG